MSYRWYIQHNFSISPKKSRLGSYYKVPLKLFDKHLNCLNVLDIVYQRYHLDVAAWMILSGLLQSVFWETPLTGPTPQALALARSWLQYWHLRANPPLLKMHTHQLLPKRFSSHQSALFEFFSTVRPLVTSYSYTCWITIYYSTFECLLNHILIKMACIVYLVDQQKSIAWKGRELSLHIFLLSLIDRYLSSLECQCKHALLCSSSPKAFLLSGI